MIQLDFRKWLSLLGNDVNMDGVIPATTIQSVSIDTRNLQAGEIYLALKGDRFDGHDFVKQACEKGAAACIVRKEWRSQKPSCLLIRVNDPLATLQRLAANYRQMFDLPVLGITGTNGKTTTKEMTALVLSKKYNVIKTPGNLNNHIGLPLSLLQIDNNTEIAIMEMGANHFGEIQHLCKIAHPTFGLITNIGAGHLEFFGSLEGVTKAKAELFERLPNEGTAFVNIDDPFVIKAARKVNNQIHYSFQKKADVSARFLELNERGCAKFRLQDKIDVELRVPGKHQIYNALAAAVVGIHWGVGLKDIAAALGSFRSYTKRMEWYELKQAVILLDAYNSNPDSLKAAIDTLIHVAKQKNGRPIAVLGDMLELGKKSSADHKQAGKYAGEKGVSELFLFGNYAADTKTGYEKSGDSLARIYSEKSVLAQELWHELKQGDVVLIKGSRGVAMETVWQQLQQLQELAKD